MLLPSRREALTRILREEIRFQGVLSFARFMELALYCPELGYYDPLTNRIGRAGDYYTSVSVGPLFGALLASRFSRWIEPVPGRRAQVVEAGAHEGTLALDLLRAWRDHHPDTYERLEYWIIEPSPGWEARQRERLREFEPRVRWLDSWRALAPRAVQGIVFANELLDALPVHRLGWDSRRRDWFEWGVGEDAGRFVWRRMEPGAGVQAAGNSGSWRPLAPEVPRALAEVLPDGFTTEVGPAAVAWWREAASRLGAGWLLTFDYGLRAEEFLAPIRAAGTLRAYHRHRQVEDLLSRPGELDLTAHVNFSAVARAGEEAGLELDRLVSQSEFLTGIAAEAWAGAGHLGAWTPDRVREFHTLTHPEHLGRAFKVLVQRRPREIPAAPRRPASCPAS